MKTQKNGNNREKTAKTPAKEKKNVKEFKMGNDMKNRHDVKLLKGRIARNTEYKKQTKIYAMK